MAESRGLSTAEALRLEIERKTARLADLRAKRESTTTSAAVAPPSDAGRGWKIGYEGTPQNNPSHENVPNQHFPAQHQQNEQSFQQQNEEDEYYYGQGEPDYDETSTVVSDLTTPTVNLKHIPHQDEHEALSSTILKQMDEEKGSEKRGNDVDEQVKEIVNIQEDLMSMALGQKRKPASRSGSKTLEDLIEDIEQEEELEVLYSKPSLRRRRSADDEGTNNDKMQAEVGKADKVGSSKNPSADKKDKTNLKGDEDDDSASAMNRLKKSTLDHTDDNKARKEEVDGAAKKTLATTSLSTDSDKFDDAKEWRKRAIHPSPEEQPEPHRAQPSKENISRHDGAKAMNDNQSGASSRNLRSSQAASAHTLQSSRQKHEGQQSPQSSRSPHRHTTPWTHNRRKNTESQEEMHRILNGKMDDLGNFDVPNEKNTMVDHREMTKAKVKSLSSRFKKDKKQQHRGDGDSSTRHSEETIQKRKRNRFSRMFGGSRKDSSRQLSRNRSVETEVTSITMTRSVEKENVPHGTRKPHPDETTRYSTKSSKSKRSTGSTSRKSNASGKGDYGDNPTKKYHTSGAAITRAVEKERVRKEVRSQALTMRSNLSNATPKATNTHHVAGSAVAHTTETRSVDEESNSMTKANYVPMSLSNESRNASMGSRKHHPDDSSRATSRSSVSGSVSQKEAEKTSMREVDSSVASTAKTPDGSHSNAASKRSSFSEDPFDPFESSPPQYLKPKAFVGENESFTGGVSSESPHEGRVAIDADGFLLTVKPPPSSEEDASPAPHRPNNNAAQSVDAGSTDKRGSAETEDFSASSPLQSKPQKGKDVLSKPEKIQKDGSSAGSRTDRAAVAAMATTKTKEHSEGRAARAGVLDDQPKNEALYNRENDRTEGAQRVFPPSVANSRDPSVRSAPAGKLENDSRGGMSSSKDEPVEEDLDKMARARMVKKRIEMLRKEVGDEEDTKAKLQQPKDPKAPKRRPSEDDLWNKLEEMRKELEEKDDDSRSEDVGSPMHRVGGDVKNGGDDKGKSDMLRKGAKEGVKTRGTAQQHKEPTEIERRKEWDLDSGIDETNESAGNKGGIDRKRQARRASLNTNSHSKENDVETGDDRVATRQRVDSRTSVRRGYGDMENDLDKNRGKDWDKEATARTRRELRSSINEPAKSEKDTGRLKRVEELKKKLQKSRERMMASAAQFDKISDDRNTTKPRARQAANTGLTSSVLEGSRERRKLRNSTDPDLTSTLQPKSQSKRSTSLPPSQRVEARKASRARSSVRRSTRGTSVPPGEKLAEKSHSRLSARSRTVLAESRERLAASRARLRTLT